MAATRGHSAHDSVSMRIIPPPPLYSTQIAAATQTVLEKEKGEVKGQW